jgi:hypothetical protein
VVVLPLYGDGADDRACHQGFGADRRHAAPYLLQFVWLGGQ